MPSETIKSPSHASEFLRTRIKERGLTQKEVARAFGLPPQSINDFFKDKRRLTFTDIALFELCGIATADEILAIEMQAAREEAVRTAKEGGLEAARAELLEEQRAQVLRRELAARGGLRHIPLDMLEAVLSSLPEKDPARVARAREMGVRAKVAPADAQAQGGEVPAQEVR